MEAFHQIKVLEVSSLVSLKPPDDRWKFILIFLSDTSTFYCSICRKYKCLDTILIGLSNPYHGVYAQILRILITLVTNDSPYGILKSLIDTILKKLRRHLIHRCSKHFAYAHVAIDSDSSVIILILSNDFILSKQNMLFCNIIILMETW